MQQTNLPSNSNASTNSQTFSQASLPQSILISQEKLEHALSQFGDDYTQMVFARYKKSPSTIEMAAASNAPTFRDVTKFFSREATLMWLRFHVAETFAFLGIYDTASKGQIMQTAELILDHEIFGQLNLDEFLMFLSRFKRGDYGKIYQSARPNPQEFLMCLRPFWNELIDHRIQVQKQIEEAQRKKESEIDKREAMTYDEWKEIKMLTAMYNPPEPHFVKTRT